MHQPHLISNAGSTEAAHYAEIDREEKRERALEVLQAHVRQDVKDHEPRTCNAYAQHCTTFFDSDVSYALCLATITGDEQLLQQALADLKQHLANELDEFVEEEAQARRNRLLAQAEEIALEAACA